MRFVPLSGIKQLVTLCTYHFIFVFFGNIKTKFEVSGNSHYFADSQIWTQGIVLMNICRNIAKTLWIARSILSVNCNSAGDTGFAANQKISRNNSDVIKISKSIVQKTGRQVHLFLFILWSDQVRYIKKERIERKIWRICRLTHNRLEYSIMYFCRHQMDP